MNLLCKIGLHSKVEDATADWIEEGLVIVSFKCAKCDKRFQEGELRPK